MMKYSINDVLYIEFDDINSISRDSIHFIWEDKSITIDTDVQYAIAIILRNTVLYENYISMSSIFSQLQLLQFYATGTDYTSFGKLFRRHISKYPSLSQAIESGNKGYKICYKEVIDVLIPNSHNSQYSNTEQTRRYGTVISVNHDEIRFRES